MAIYDFNWYGGRPLENFAGVGEIDNLPLNKYFFDVTGRVDHKSIVTKLLILIPV